MKPLSKNLGLLERVRRLEVHVRVFERENAKKHAEKGLINLTRRIDELRLSKT